MKVEVYRVGGNTARGSGRARNTALKTMKTLLFALMFVGLVTVYVHLSKLLTGMGV